MNRNRLRRIPLLIQLDDVVQTNPMAGNRDKAAIVLR